MPYRNIASILALGLLLIGCQTVDNWQEDRGWKSNPYSISLEAAAGEEINDGTDLLVDVVPCYEANAREATSTAAEWWESPEDPPVDPRIVARFRVRDGRIDHIDPDGPEASAAGTGARVTYAGRSPNGSLLHGVRTFAWFAREPGESDDEYTRRTTLMFPRDVLMDLDDRCGCIRIRATRIDKSIGH